MRNKKLSVRLIRTLLELGTICGILLCFGGIAQARSARHVHRHLQVVSESESMDVINSMSTIVVDRLWDRTDFWWHLGDYPRIIALDRTISEAEPNFLEPYATGGWLMESGGDLKDAEAYYRLGVNRNPGKSYAYYQLGAFYYNTMHDYARSAAVFARSTTFADAGDLDWKMYAHSLEHIHKLSQALAVWQTIKKKFPHSPAVESNLMRVQRLIAASNNKPSVPAGPVQQ